MCWFLKCCFPLSARLIRAVLVNLFANEILICCAIKTLQKSTHGLESRQEYFISFIDLDMHKNAIMMLVIPIGQLNDAFRKLRNKGAFHIS